MKITKVYTKTGDKGTTSLVGGIRIGKAGTRIEAYGTVDELNSQLGLLAAHMTADDDRRTVEQIQSILFNVGTHLATDLSQTPLYPSARLPEDASKQLEEEIDRTLAILPEAQGFILLEAPPPQPRPTSAEASAGEPNAASSPSLPKPKWGRRYRHI